MADSLMRALAARKPASPRFTIAYHESTGLWSACLFAGGEQIASGESPTLCGALDALAAFAESGALTPDQALAARMREAGGAGHPTPRRSRAALLD